jgi:CBS domain-containing membrane protein
MTSPDSTVDRLRSIEHHEEFEHVVVLLEHLRLTWLLRHSPPRVVHAIYVLINGFITVAILAVLAFVTGSPFVFPSVGPSAYLFFFTPMAKSASPRHAILGHGIGLICGYLALMVTGASAFPFSAHVGFHWQLILSAALSLSVTGAIMILMRVSHPPAGATTLIVSLGIIYRPIDLLIIEAAVVLLVLQALAINRLAGVPYPFWNPAKSVPPLLRS